MVADSPRRRIFTGPPPPDDRRSFMFFRILFMFFIIFALVQTLSPDLMARNSVANPDDAAISAARPNFAILAGAGLIVIGLFLALVFTRRTRHPHS